MASTTRRGDFPILHFVHNCRHNSKTKGSIRTFCLWNDCPTIRYLFSCLDLYARYDWRVMDTNMHRKHFLMGHFVHNYTRNSKTTGCMEISTYQMTVLLSEMSIFCVRTRCDIWMVSDAFKHASQSLSDKPFFHIVYLNILLENFRSYVDVQHIKQLLYYWRHCYCGLECSRDTTRELRPETYIGCSLIQLCMRILQVRKYVSAKVGILPK